MLVIFLLFKCLVQTHGSYHKGNRARYKIFRHNSLQGRWRLAYAVNTEEELPLKKSTSIISYIRTQSNSGVRTAGAGSPSAHPKFWFVKNLGKVSKNVGKLRHFLTILMKLYVSVIECININLLFNRKYIKYIYNQRIVFSNLVFLFVRVDK